MAMRYQVGSKVPFLVIQYEASTGRKYLNGFGSTFMPWEGTLLNIHVEMLECIEHHKVPNAYDESDTPTLDCDGFIFKAEAGFIWHNQYPRASYGQVSDTADRIVSRAFPEGTDHKTIDVENTIIYMESAFHRLAEMHRGIYHFQTEATDENREKCEQYATLLTELANQTQQAIEKVSGRKVVLDKLTYGPDKQWLEGHYRARFETEAEESHIGG